MKLSKIVGTHTFNNGRIIIRGQRYHLQIAPLPNKDNRKYPSAQIIYKDKDSLYHDTRLSGLWPILGGHYRGSIGGVGFKIIVGNCGNCEILKTPK